MTKTKTATQPTGPRFGSVKPPYGAYQITNLFIYCPHCNEGIVDRRDGSYVIHSGSGYAAHEIVTCNFCDETFRVPGILGKLNS